MNTFVSRFASTSSQRAITDDDDKSGSVSDSMWGSAGGFGNMVDGTPSFQVPAVPNVSLLSIHSRIKVEKFHSPVLS